MTAANGLGSKLGPVLLQLPPTLRADPDALDATLRAFPKAVRLALEARHPSWYDDRIHKVLVTRRAAWVWVDPGDRKRPRWRTAEWGYMRFHGGTGSPPSCYTRSPLQTWARRLSEVWTSSEDVYCFFNNDGNGCAPHDARRFAGSLRNTGLHPSRIPRRNETPVVRN